MRAVDTNVLVRLLVRDDRAQLAAAEDFIASGVWVSLVVLVETIWVLRSAHRMTHRQLVSVVEMLLDHRDIVIEKPDVVALAFAQFRRSPKLSFPDCVVLESAKKAGHTPLGTFDRELSKRAGAKRISA